jgi:hypothetical protein
MPAAGQGAFRGRKPRDGTFKSIKPRLRSGRAREARGAQRRSRCFGALSAVTRMRTVDLRSTTDPDRIRWAESLRIGDPVRRRVGNERSQRQT